MEKNKKEGLNKNEENKRIFILVVVILVVMLVFYLIINFIGGKYQNDEKSMSSIISNSETAVLYIWNSDSKKCKDCKEIKNHLDKKKVNYIGYDVKNYEKNEYEKLLTTLSINPPDFNYPAVIYVKEGAMYSNIINISDTKTVDTFIKEYKLENVK